MLLLANMAQVVSSSARRPTRSPSHSVLILKGEFVQAYACVWEPASFVIALLNRMSVGRATVSVAVRLNSTVP